MVVLTVFTFAACAGNEPVDSGKVTVVEYVAEGDDIEYVVELNKVENATSLFDVLNYLKNSRNLTFTYSESTYGVMVSAFGSLSEDAAAGRYLYFYTSVESDFDVSEYAMTKTYKEKTLGSSGVGVGSMKLEDGATYYIDYVTYN